MSKSSGRLLACLATTALAYVPLSAGTRVLSFADRVAAERALARVAYSHEIGPTRAFDELYPEALLVARVRRTLVLSRALEAEWATPVSAGMLRAEVERMARATRMPGRLRELFGALDDDPTLVEECLARPIVVERLVRNFVAADTANRRVPGHGRPLRESSFPVNADDPVVSAGSALPKILDRRPGSSGRRYEAAGVPSACLFDDAWDSGALDEPPDPRAQHTAVWTGSVMIVWGGSPITGTGARYDPATDTWSSVSKTGAPSPRYGHTAVWTGSHMLVWGGTNGATYLADGGSYDPASDQWTPLPSAGAPSARSGHTAVWTGTRMVVWGGLGTGSVVHTGAVYDPEAGVWTPTSGARAPAARTGHTAVWTGTRMIVWGGTNGPGFFSSGASYDPVADSWTSLAPLAPGRAWHTAVWTGSRMVIWGGFDGAVSLNSGGRYDPGANAWQATATVLFTPIRRLRHAAVWTGTEMVVWGGVDHTGALQQFGGVYDPTIDTWATVATTDAPAPRQLATGVWTGTRVLFWGGRVDSGALATGGRYDPFASQWTPISTGDGPSARTGHTTVWTGSRWIVWGGNDGVAPLDSGSVYDPATAAWSPTSEVGSPEARDGHSAVWTGGSMVVWGGRDNAGLKNDGARYDPVSDQWLPVALGGAPSPRTDHRAVWTGSRMLVWGGDGVGGALADGARYDPAANSWSSLSGVASPSARSRHVAVWTGSRMLIWGGVAGASFRSDGGKYDPATNSWSTLSATNAPSARTDVPGVWTGTHLFVWGGYDGLASLGTGALYEPILDQWSPTSPAGAPAPRRRHSAVWNDRFVLVWGGNGAAGRDGARYDPFLDRWAPIELAEAPSGRAGHAALWTGTRMLVWGGSAGAALASGGVYDPGVAENDPDLDGACDPLDNCPAAANPSQRDFDGDLLGDACDPFQVDFTPSTSPVAAGFLKDDGALYTPARGFGWDGPVSARERVTAAPLELDTFVFSSEVRRWTCEFPDGFYLVRVSVGDALFTQGPQRVVVYGDTAVDGITTLPAGFVQASVPIEVRGGRFDVAIGGAGGNTTLNWVAAYRSESQPAFERAVNFEPAASAVPAGFLPDRGEVFDPGRGYGWSAVVGTRERGALVPQTLDTFAFSAALRTWEMVVPSGTYQVRVSVGDTLFAQGPQRLVVEGATVVNDETTAAGTFFERDVTVIVTDGRLTLAVGGAGGNTAINYVSFFHTGP